MERTDEELMLAVASGDLDAFGELVRRHRRSAWNVAWRMLQDPTEAEDAAQDAFLKILNAAPRYPAHRAASLDPIAALRSEGA